MNIATKNGASFASGYVNGGGGGDVIEINDGKTCFNIEAGHVMSAMDAQKPHISAWLWFAYARFWSTAQQDLLFVAVAKALCRASKQDLAGLSRPPKLHAGDLYKIYRCMRLAIVDYRLRCSTSGGHTIEPKLYGYHLRLTEGQRAHFHRDWGPFIARIHKVIELWDAEGVQNVSERIDFLRERD